VKAALHRQLKRICFNHDVKLQDLAEAIIESVLNEEKKLTLIIERLKKIWHVAARSFKRSLTDTVGEVSKTYQNRQTLYI